MAKYVAENTVKSLIKANKRVKGTKLAVLGVTFKEDCPDTRNTKEIDIIKELKEYKMYVVVTDPFADKDELSEEYGLELEEFENITVIDAIVLAVSHSKYRNMDINDFHNLYVVNNILGEVAATIEVEEKNVFIDVYAEIKVDGKWGMAD